MACRRAARCAKLRCFCVLAFEEGEPPEARVALDGKGDGVGPFATEEAAAIGARRGCHTAACDLVEAARPSFMLWRLTHVTAAPARSAGSNDGRDLFRELERVPASQSGFPKPYELVANWDTNLPLKDFVWGDASTN